MAQAILRTDRIRLVPLSDEHLDHEVELDSDPEVMRYDLGLTRVFAETMTVNTASRATMATLGMRHIRTFHVDDDEPLPGSHLGEVEYAVTRQEWLADQATEV